jgi:hypothetical protein
MLFVCFTYGPDAPLLAMASRRIRSLDPSAIIVAIDDPDHPTPVDLQAADVSYRLSSFSRGGNLNGLDCIAGMLSTMAELMAEHEADHVVKFDSDLWANNLSAFLTSTDSGSYDYLATERWHFAQPAGYIYRISRRLVDRLAAEISARREAGLFPPNNPYPEDQTIYALALQLHASAALIPYTSGASTGLTDCSPDNLASATTADVVHCGEPLPDGSRASRLHVLGRMATLAHHVHFL